MPADRASRNGSRAMARRHAGRGELEEPVDLTSMIDVVFLLLIFFMLTSTMRTQQQVDIPPSVTGTGVDPSTSTIFVVRPPSAGQEGASYAYLDDQGKEIPIVSDEKDPEKRALDIDKKIEAAIELGVSQDKLKVIINAGQTVRDRDVHRIAKVAAAIKDVDIRIYLGVKEKS